MPYISCNGDLYDDEDIFVRMDETTICEDEDFEEEFLEKDDLIDRWEFRLMMVRQVRSSLQKVQFLDF